MVVQHGEVGTLGNGRKHQVSRADRAVLAPVGQEQHDLRRAIEVGLMGGEQRERSYELVVDPARIASAEQGFQVEDAATSDLAFLLQVEEQSGNGWMGKTGVHAVVQQVR